MKHISDNKHISAGTSLRSAVSVLSCISVFSLALTACAEPRSGQGEEVLKSAEDSAPVEVEIDSRTSMNRHKQVLYAQAEIANKLNITKDEVGLPSVQSVSWRSGALGCPKPNVMYTQALVRGVLMVFKVQGQVLRYHASETGVPFFCPASQAEDSGAGVSEI